MSRSLARAGLVLRIIVVAGLLVYAVSRLLSDEASPALDWFGYAAIVLAAAGSVWIAGERPDADRLGSRLLAAGIASWGVGVLIDGYDEFVRGVVSIPSIADAAYLLFVPLAFLAIGRLLIRSRAMSVGDALDAMVVGLAVIALGAALAVRLDLPQAVTGALATATQLLYPMSDVVLVAFVLAAAASQGFRLSPRAALLATGLTVFAIGDAAYVVRTITGTYASGTLLDVSWLLGLTLLSEAPWRPGRVGRPVGGRTASLVATVAAVGVAMAILVHFSLQDVALPWLVAIPIAATLLAAIARLFWALREADLAASASSLARTDTLTGLPNRRAFLERLDGLAGSGQAFDVLLVDLDRFKEVNDALGHHTGDLLLAAVADRLGQARQAGAFLARLGGDEFGLVTQAGDGERQAERIGACLDADFPVAGIPLRIGASIGISCRADDASDLGDVMRHADVAMYRAKRQHAGFARYDDDVDRVDANRLALATDLARAVREPEILVRYQPIVDRDGCAVALEALVRWQHPRLGLLGPQDFLPLAQQTGLMAPLTASVLHQAVRDASRLQADGHRLRVCVNLTAADISDVTLAEMVREACATHELDSGALGVEITEEAIVGEPAAARAVIARLREAGIAIAIDDFGTGYSSLALLQELPVTHLKVDRRFTEGLASDDPAAAERAGAVMRTIIELGHRLGLRTVVEGIETPAQRDAVLAMGCDALQGFLVGRPQAIDEISGWLATAMAPTPGDR